MLKLYSQSNIQEILVSAVRVTDISLRKTYDEEKIGELGASIEEMGTLQLIIVRPTREGVYELIIGSRRLRVAQQKGVEKIIACVVSGVDDQMALEMALAENLHREDLTPFEEALAILKLFRDYHLSEQQVSERIGKSRRFIQRRLQLLSLPKEIQQLVSERKLGVRHVDTLAGLPNEEKQIEYAQKSVQEGFTADELCTALQSEIPERGQRAPRKYKKILRVQRIKVKIARSLKFLKTIPHETHRMSFDEIAQVVEELKCLQQEISNLIEKIDET